MHLLAIYCSSNRQSNCTRFRVCAYQSYTSRLLLCQTKTVEPHYLNTCYAKQKISYASYMGEPNGIIFVSHEGHDFRHKIKNKTVKCCPGLEQHTSRAQRIRSSHEYGMVGNFCKGFIFAFFASQDSRQASGPRTIEIIQIQEMHVELHSSV